MRSAAFVLLLCWPAMALGQDQVLLAEVMPELAGSELGELAVADAPSTGGSLVVRRSDVQRALKAANQSTEGLEIPKSTRISRKLVQLSAEALIEDERGALEQAANPCTVQEVKGPKQVSLSEGPRQTRVELAGGRRTGRVSGSVIVQTGARQVRVPLMLKLLCPEPEVTSGKQVELVVRVGNVSVRTAGEARQNGRTGEIIRVTNRSTGASLRGRVIDAHTVEVQQ